MNDSVRCVTCGADLAGRYCANCGEAAPHQHDYSIRHFLAEAVESLFNLDGRVLGSFRTLLKQPGLITLDYLAGRRKPYVKPIQLFLIANLIYFAIQPLTSFNSFTTRLTTHLEGEGTIVWEHLARTMVDRRLAVQGSSIDNYRARFDDIAHLLGKSLVIVMVPAFALGVWACYWPRRRYYVEHLFFSVHFYTFMLLATAALSLLTQIVLMAAARLDIRFSGTAIEIGSSAATLLVLALYLFAALSRVFARPWAATAVATLALTVWMVVVLSAYRFVLFLATFAAT